MPHRLSPSYEMANCFPAMQCLSGNPPSECTSNANLICPVLPVASPTNEHPHMNFYRNNSYTGSSTMTASSDSEDSINGLDTTSLNPNNFARTSVQFPTASRTTNSATPTPALRMPPASPPRPTTRPHRRIPHTIIERRYRDNLNTSIETLRLCVPSLKDVYNASGSPPDLEDSAALPVRLPSKAVIIGTAAAYIKELEAEKRTVEQNAERLRDQVAELQKLIQCNDCSILQYLQQVGSNNGVQVPMAQ